MKERAAFIDSPVLIKAESLEKSKEPVYQFDGIQATESELKDFITQSSYYTQFKIGVFFKFFMYHMLHFCTSPFIAVPIIFVFEGFNGNLLHNIAFIGW